MFGDCQARGSKPPDMYTKSSPRGGGELVAHPLAYDTNKGGVKVVPPQSVKRY